MTNHDIEMIGINGVKELCVKTGYLTPYINENDKEPSWDGEIYIYDNERKTKDCFYGKVAVQVKGVFNNDFSQKKIKYDIDVSDLKAYRKIGGTLFMVSYVSSDLNKFVYYITLSPIKLIEILKDCSNQTTKRLELKAFPDNGKKIVNVFMNFFDNCKKQRSFSEKTMISINELKKNGITNLTSSVMGFGYDPDDCFTPFLENEVYFYCRRNDGIELPVLMTPTKIAINQRLPARVTVNDVEFYKYIELKRTNDGTLMLIGRSVSFPFNKNNAPQKITYKFCDNLNDQIVDLDFIITAIENNGYEINGCKMNLSLTSEEEAHFDINSAKERLATLKRIKSVLTKLNIKKDINLKTITENDQNKLNVLVGALLHEQPVALAEGMEGARYFQIQSINVLLVFKLVEGKRNNLYNVSDFFNSDLRVTYEDYDTQKDLVCSKFSALSVADYCKADNIDYSKIVIDYKKVFEENPAIIDGATDTILSLLLAYDKTHNKEQLKAAEELNNWLIDNKAEKDNSIYFLNKLQIIKRQRDLTEEEKTELIKLVEQNDIGEEIKVGAYLLLDNQIAAKMHFAKLTDDWKDCFKHLPINKFWEE